MDVLSKEKWIPRNRLDELKQANDITLFTQSSGC